jgi:hypothetical protein
MRILNFILLILICTFPILTYSIEISGNEFSLNFQGDFEFKKLNTKTIGNSKYYQLQIEECRNTGRMGEAELPVYTKLVSLPPTGNFSITGLKYEYEVIDIDKKIVPFGMQEENTVTEFYEKNSWFPSEIVSVGDPVIMRGNRFVQITIAAVQYNPVSDQIRIFKDIDFNFEIDYQKTENPLTKTVPSNSFANIVEKNIYGAEVIRNTDGGQYLIIAPNGTEALLEPLLRWKEQLGFKTRLATISETGSSTNAIKAYIQNAYDNWETPPEYVILAGDVNGAYQIPAFYVEGYYTPWDVSDHNYTLLDGEDYFPDILIGRLSYQDQMQLNTIVSKIINYERNPVMGNNWMKRALMMAYVDDWWMQLFSARETVMAVREKLLDYEFTEVDTFISPYQNGTTTLINKINSGHTFLNYRGAGSPSGVWGCTGPMFTIYDILSLNNGFMLPMVTSITCGGGDFATPDYSSCYGETWLNAGTPSVPKGAIGFIGPSEHDTKTWFNNANDLGIYQGITQEDLFRCGEMLLRGKMELYVDYPNNHAWGGAEDSDQFYFYVYNLIGDPGLQVWTDIPREVEMDFETEINTGYNYLHVQIDNTIEDPEDFTIAITNADSLISVGISDENGMVDIPISLPVGAYKVTSSKYGCIPQETDLDVIEENTICLNSFTLDETIAGETIDLEITIQNIGNITATDVQISLESDEDFLTVTSGPVNIIQLEADEIYNGYFQFEIDDSWRNGLSTRVFLQVNSSYGEQDFIIPFEISSPEFCISEFMVNNAEGCLLQNEVNEVSIQLLNCGNLDSEALDVDLLGMNTNSEIISGISAINPIVINSTGITIDPFQVEIFNSMSGELAAFRLEVSDSETILQQLDFTIPIGIISEESTTFSNYGYYAIESTDSGNFIAPQYNWIEIDPSYGGIGTIITGGYATSDGSVTNINLPFTFQYFGEAYNQASICSNGWVGMGTSEIMFHLNRNIPSGAGPKAMIAPFWDNLTNGELYTYYNEDEHYFVIEWSDFRSYYNFSFEIFEIILYDPLYYPTETGDGEILFQYKDINNVDQEHNYATIGIENAEQTDGLLLSYANIYPATVHQIQDETAIFISTYQESYVHNDEEIISPNTCSLEQNYPNPFNPETTISFFTAEDAKNSELVIYNLKGQEVKTLVNKVLPAGEHSVVWDGKDDNNKPVSSGIYFYKLKASDFQKVKKMLLMK